mgnify:CR=1 FL=1
MEKFNHSNFKIGQTLYVPDGCQGIAKTKIERIIFDDCGTTIELGSSFCICFDTRGEIEEGAFFRSLEEALDFLCDIVVDEIFDRLDVAWIDDCDPSVLKEYQRSVFTRIVENLKSKGFNDTELHTIINEAPRE